LSNNAIVVGNNTSEAFTALVKKCASLSRKQGLKLTAVIVSEHDTDVGAVYASGAENVLRLPLSFRDVNAEAAAAASLARLSEELEPVFIVFESSSFFCSVAPMLSVLCDCGITADCTDLSFDKPLVLRQTRPAFGGRKLAHIENTKNPTIATVRRGVFPRAELTEYQERKAGLIESAPVACEWMLETLSESIGEAPDLMGARIIVSGGMGMGSRENYKKLYRLAEALHAQVGASRAAVAAGYAGYEHQVGQTGVSVRPELYIAFGISGAVQHLSGIAGAKSICAVNTDPKAPIHEHSDFSVIADCNEVIDEMLKKLKL